MGRRSDKAPYYFFLGVFTFSERLLYQHLQAGSDFFASVNLTLFGLPGDVVRIGGVEVRGCVSVL